MVTKRHVKVLAGALAEIALTYALFAMIWVAVLWVFSDDFVSLALGPWWAFGLPAVVTAGVFVYQRLPDDAPKHRGGRLQ